MAERHPDLGPDPLPLPKSVTDAIGGGGPFKVPEGERVVPRTPERLINVTSAPCVGCGVMPGDDHAGGCSLPLVRQFRKEAPAALVDHIRPKHYGGADDPYEPLKVMLAQHGRDAVVSFCWLTAEKYLARAGKKPGEPIERDFRKAAFYLTHAAELLERKP